MTDPTSGPNTTWVRYPGSVSMDTDSPLYTVYLETLRQDAKWGVQDHPYDTPDGYWASRGAHFEASARRSLKEDGPSWAAILMEEVGEAFQAESPEALEAELVQVAAVAIQWVAAIQRRNAPKEAPMPTPATPILTYEVLLEAFVYCTGGEAYGTDTDCVRAVLEVLEYQYGRFTEAARKDVLISHGDLAHPWSGAVAVVEHVPGAMNVERPVPGRVHFLQGWRALNDGRIPSPPVKGPNGHAGFLYAHPDGQVRFVNANIKGSPWVRKTTWQAIRDTYLAGVRLVALP